LLSFHHTASTDHHTLSLHDALPISGRHVVRHVGRHGLRRYLTFVGWASWTLPPPSSRIVWPVMKSLPSEARKSRMAPSPLHVVGLQDHTTRAGSGHGRRPGRRLGAAWSASSRSTT